MKQAASKQEFPLAPMAPWTWPALLGLWALLLLFAFLGGTHVQSPTNPVPWWVVVPFGTALVPAGLLSMLAHRQISIEDNRLLVAGALLFARKVAISDLALDKARILNLDEHTEYKPMLRLFGFNFPGLTVGTCLLRNRSRAFCLLTSQPQALLLPQRNGGLILVSPEKPQALLDALRAA
ncbi:PH domain-containing protein [Thermomonas sp. S9]|uniref:PH domain-containing protein n=1 Tax=Thermomonas sp. S9 TaxID=2885203 RepID=UPI00216AEFB1|nr:PH domain-containing protein [Thermomonas sp. S9]MCR6495794.1 PH domain-containing protein [Thermomonas sp. S9]